MALVPPDASYLTPVDQTVVFVVTTNPEPGKVITLLNRKHSVVGSDSCRPESAHLLEVQ
jgi:hypothetical protein